jgi:hypothetical protein
MMNFKNYTEGTRATHGTDPTEWNGKEAERCTLCDNDLTPEEIEESQDDEKLCNNCFFSCCGAELDQDIRICPICKEHN